MQVSTSVSNLDCNCILVHKDHSTTTFTYTCRLWLDCFTAWYCQPDGTSVGWIFWTTCCISYFKQGNHKYMATTLTICDLTDFCVAPKCKLYRNLILKGGVRITISVERSIPATTVGATATQWYYAWYSTVSNHLELKAYLIHTLFLHDPHSFTSTCSLGH